MRGKTDPRSNAVHTTVSGLGVQCRVGLLLAIPSNRMVFGGAEDARDSVAKHVRLERLDSTQPR